jgi:hypothetical protein
MHSKDHQESLPSNRPRAQALVVVALGCLFHFADPAGGTSIRFVPDEVLLAESEIVVLGTYLGEERKERERPLVSGPPRPAPVRDPFINIMERNRARNRMARRRPTLHADRIAVIEVLKGLDLAEALLRSHDFSDDEDRDWIWLLKRRERTGLYEIQRTLELEKLDWVRDRLANLESRAWSDLVGGLQGLLVVGMTPYGNHSLHHVFRNVSGHRMYVLRNHRLPHLSVTVDPSDGPARKLPLSSSGHDPETVTLQRHEFVPIEPGETKSIVLRGCNLGPLEEGKRYRLEVTYRNDWDGEEFGLENVWTGELTVETQVGTWDGVVEYGPGIEIEWSKP